MDDISMCNFLYKRFHDYDEIVNFAKDCQDFFIKRFGFDDHYSENSFERYGYIMVSFTFDNCDYTIDYSADTKQLKCVSIYIKHFD